VQRLLEPEVMDDADEAGDYDSDRHMSLQIPRRLS
jgi:hypothetical protein